EAALALWERTGDTQWGAKTRLELGRIQLASGELTEAESNLSLAAQTFKTLGDRSSQAEVGLTLAQAFLLRGELSRTRDSLERAQEDAEAGGAGRSVLRIRAQLARLSLVQGDLARAQDQAERVAEDAARQGLVDVEALARVVFGLAHLLQGRPQDAERQLRDAFVLARQRGARALEARARLAIARVHLTRGEPAGALGEVSQARDLAHELEDVHLEVLSLLSLARLHRFLGQLKRAESILEMAGQRVEEINLALARPEVALATAACLLDQARGAWVRDQDASEPLEQAGEQLSLAERGLRAGSRRGLRAELDLLRAEQAFLSGSFADARERAEAALEVMRLSGNALSSARAERAIARARVEQGRYEEAATSAERAVKAADGIQDGEAHAAALLERGLARRKMGQIIQAAQDLRDAASQVRGVWASLSEDLRDDYAAKPLVREIIKLAQELGEEAEAFVEASGERKALPSKPSAQPAGLTAPAAASAAPAVNVAEAAEPSDSLETLRDSLTNLFNHTFFTAQLETEIKRGQRHSRPLALLKINIDRFKLVRELYGPKAAKDILREVSELLLRNVRDVDIVARYFGDEFEVLLPDTDQHGALLTSKRIAEAVEGHRFEHDDEKIELTLTIGVALFPQDAKDKDALICRVDEALYNARTRGPNQVFTFGGSDDPATKGETAAELREIDEMMLSREGRTILSMVQRLVNQELDIDRMIELVTGMVVEATRGERGFIMLKGPTGEFSFRHGRNIDDKVINLPELKISNNIAKDVAQTGKAVHVSEAIEDDRFRGFKSVMDLGLRSIICAPIHINDEVLGVIYVDHNQVARNFAQEDLNFLTAIADKVAIPLRNSARLRETEDKLALAEARLKSQAAQLQTKYKYDTIIGRSEAMQQVFKLLDRIVETSHSVVIHGESGTGKELIARAIH
ncbi:MAG TPA: hypothetical protein DEA08_27850, partial [Planctomycetes bacterium]|nr:hypothetical protein [Planctomycetota bacterium]